MTINHLFAVYFHLYLQAVLVIAAIIAAPTILAIAGLFIRTPGTFRQRVRGLGGGD